MKSKVHIQTVVLSAFLWMTMPEVAAEEWICRVHFESQCTESGCIAYGDKEDGNTKPVFAQFDDEGNFQICMYSGCYEGKGRILTTHPFLSIVQERVKWTGTSPDETDIFIVLQRNELIGMFKATSFVQPIICNVIEDEE